MPYDQDGNWIAYPDPVNDPGEGEDASGQPYNNQGQVGGGNNSGGTPGSTGTPAGNTPPPVDPYRNPSEDPAQVASWKAVLQQRAAQQGVPYDDSMLQDVIRNVSYARNAGRDPGDILNQSLATINRRASNSPGAGAGGGGGGGTPMNNVAGGGGGDGSGASGMDWFGANGPPQWQPFTEQFQAPAGAPTGFKAPTESDMIANDPGYQARMDAAQQAMQRSAAAKGNLLTGGTAKALGQAMQDYGSNEYQNYYGQKTNEYNTGVNDYNNSYNRAMGEYQNRYNISTGNQTNQIGTQRNNMLDAYGMYSQDRQMSDQENAQAFNQYLGLNQLYANIGLGLSGQGLNGAAYLNQAGNGVGQALGNLGNANAAGTVQNGNTWQNFYGNMANTWNPNTYAQQRR